MEPQYGRFQYRSLPEVPSEFRRIDWTYVDVHDKPFSVGEDAFRQLRDASRELCAGKPFAYLHFLRAIEDRLMMLAVETKQPLSKCLEILRRRLDLEYGRNEVFGKAAQAVVFAGYAIECGETKLAKTILKDELSELRAAAEICRSWIETITQRVEQIGP